MIEPRDRASDLLLALGRVPYLRAREKALLIDACGNAECVFALSIKDVQSIIGRRFRTTIDWKLDGFFRRAEADARLIAAGKIGAICILDANYPAQLAEVFDPPFLLYYRGVWPCFDIPAVAIVGTRNPTGAARTEAYRFALGCAEAGLCIVSGLARGIDQEAHAGTVSVRGKAIAVLGNGIDAVYPRTSERLARQIIEHGGAIISENPPGTPPLKFRFPERNRIISGLSRAIVIVQAPAHSGALITADFGLEQGRDLFVHRVGLGGENGEGTTRLARDGARIVTDAADLLSEWGCESRSRSTHDPGNARTGGGSPGERLANMLASELVDEAVSYNGETIRRNPVP